MAINFPSTNLTPGTIHTDAGVSWKWDGTTWQASAPGSNNAGGQSEFIGLTDTPNNFTGAADKWLKVNVGATALEFTNSPTDVVYGAIANFPSAATHKSELAYSDADTALYYSDGTSWTTNRLVTTSSTTTSDFSTLLGNFEKTYVLSINDHSAGTAQQNATRKVIRLSDSDGTNNDFVLAVTGNTISIDKTNNIWGVDEVTIKGQEYQVTVQDDTPSTDAKIRLSGIDHPTTQDITIQGKNGIIVTREDGQTLGIAAPSSTVTQYTDDMAKDAVWNAINAGTHQNVTPTYDSTNRYLSFASSGGGGGGSSVEVPVFDQSESTSGGTYTTAATYGGGHIVNYANTGANRHVDVKFEKLDNDKIYEFVLSYGSNGTDPYYGWYFADKQTTRSDNNGPTNAASSKRISDKINGANTSTDHWKSYSRVNATDRYIEGDSTGYGTTWNWPANGMEWDPMQTGPYGNPQAEIGGWHFVIDMPRNKIWVKEYNESWQNGDTGVFKVGSTTQGDPTDPLTAPSIFLRRAGTGDYYFNIGMFIPSDGIGSCAVYAINEEHSAFRQGTIGGGGGGGASVLYDLTVTSSTSSHALVNLVPSTGTTDTIEVVGVGGTTVSKDASASQIKVESLAYEVGTPAAASGSGSLGLVGKTFTYTPPDLQNYLTSVPVATASTVGTVKPGTGCSVTVDGTLNIASGGYTLPAATTTELGGVKVDGTSITIDANDVISSSGGSTVPSITDLPGTTASVAPDTAIDLNITGYKGYVLYKVTASHESWVRIYVDDATRQNDSTRSQGEDPAPGSGCIAEVITTGSNQSILITPGVMGFNNDSPAPQEIIYASVTNRSNSAVAITVTLTALKIGE